MPNNAGLGDTAYTPTPLPTTLSIRLPVRRASKLVRLSPALMVAPDNAIVDGQTVTATRVDAAGSATGTIIIDDLAAQYATFAAPIAAGTWDFAVS